MLDPGTHENEGVLAQAQAVTSMMGCSRRVPSYVVAAVQSRVSRDCLSKRWAKLSTGSPRKAPGLNCKAELLPPRRDCAFRLPSRL